MKFNGHNFCEYAEFEQIEGEEYTGGEELETCNQDELPADYTAGQVNVNDCIDKINDLTNNICSAVTTWKEIDMQMHNMDIQFETFSKQMDVNLDMYRQRAPIVSRQLDSLSGMMNKILDKVLTMDAQTESEINDKMRLMDSVDTYVDRITTMMTKLL